MKKSGLAFLARCNGHKRLVRGNHDIFDTKLYMEYFEEIYATRVFDDMILSHIPLHIQSIKSEWTNVHGHTHNNTLPLHFGPKYFNVCVEYTDYGPLALEEVRQRIRQQQSHWETTEIIDKMILEEVMKELDKKVPPTVSSIIAGMSL